MILVKICPSVLIPIDLNVQCTGGGKSDPASWLLPQPIRGELLHNFMILVSPNGVKVVSPCSYMNRIL